MLDENELSTEDEVDELELLDVMLETDELENVVVSLESYNGMLDEVEVDFDVNVDDVDDEGMVIIIEYDVMLHIIDDDDEVAELVLAILLLVDVNE